MKDTKLLPDDPQLTAYALGELTGDQRAAIEAALRQQPELRATIEEIRAMAQQMEDALAGEAAEAAVEPVIPFPGARATPPLFADEDEPIEEPDMPARAATVPPYERRARWKLLRFPQFYYVVGGFAAACFAVIAVLYQDVYDAKQQARVAQQRQRTAEQQAKARREVMAIPLAPAADSAPQAGGTNVASTSPAEVRPTVEPTPKSASATPTTAAPVYVGGGLSLSESTKAERATTPTSAPTNQIAPERTVAATTESAGNATPAPGAPAVEPKNGAVAAVTSPPEPTAAGFAVQKGLPPPTSALAPEFTRSTEAYAATQDNDFLPTEKYRFSSFAVDVDTASYTNVRRIIEYGTLPPRDAVRVEELLNYFPYHYPAPPPRDGAPFAASLEVAEAPWAPQHRLVRIGLKAREVTTAERGPANLVFLLDVSGSMEAPNKLPLVKDSMRLLLGKLRPDDRVAIVACAGQPGLALPPTPVARAADILQALDRLTVGGATNGGMGLHLAYDIAKANFAKDGINRVIFCTDGDFNTGAMSEAELLRLVEERSRTGVFLTVLGFGMGNYKDATLARLANHGCGNYGYIDSRRAAEKLLVDQVSSTLVAVAKDVKIQVEFNPEKVARYRLIGYENRVLSKEDYEAENVDAGEIGAGHTVTALYEIVPVGAEGKFRGAPAPVDDVKYVARGAVSSRLEMPITPPKPPPSSDALLTVKVRYKKPDAFFAERKEFALKDEGRRFDKASPDFRFAAAVAQFGMILRGSPHKGSATIGDVIAWAATASASPADDPGGYRGEFIDLARKAARMVQ